MAKLQVPALAGIVALVCIAIVARSAQQPSIVFIEVPSSQSKITWKHDNGISDARHLPETCGGGGLFFDYDNDGDLDVLVINNGEAPVLLRNEGGNRNNWLGLELVAKKSNPGAIGAVIAWEAGGQKRSRYKTTGGRFLSSHDLREILGAGSAKRIDRVEIKWPSGTVDELTNLDMNKYIKVVEGSGASKT